MSHASYPMFGCNHNCYYYLLLTSFVCLFVRSFVCVCALTIPSEVQTVQDVILSLMNHALTSNLSSGLILLDHLELRLNLLPLGFVTKLTAYW